MAYLSDEAVVYGHQSGRTRLVIHPDHSCTVYTRCVDDFGNTYWSGVPLTQSYDLQVYLAEALEGNYIILSDCDKEPQS